MKHVGTSSFNPFDPTREPCPTGQCVELTPEGLLVVVGILSVFVALLFVFLHIKENSPVRARSRSESASGFANAGPDDEAERDRAR